MSLMQGNVKSIQPIVWTGVKMSIDNDFPAYAKKILFLAIRTDSIKIKTISQYFKPGFFHHFAGDFIQV